VEEPTAASLIWSCRLSNQSNAYLGKALTAGVVAAVQRVDGDGGSAREQRCGPGLFRKLRAEMVLLLLPSMMMKDGAHRKHIQVPPKRGSSWGREKSGCATHFRVPMDLGGVVLLTAGQRTWMRGGRCRGRRHRVPCGLARWELGVVEPRFHGDVVPVHPLRMSAARSTEAGSEQVMGQARATPELYTLKSRRHVGVPG